MSELYLGDQLITPVVMETVVKDDFNELKNKPQINDVELVGNKTLDELGIQAKGDYALTSDIPDLTDYVKNTDYPVTGVAGVVKASGTFACGVTNGFIQTLTLPVGTRYNNLNQYAFIGKGTLENIKDDYVKRGVTQNQTELTEEEKANAKNWLGFATPTEIMQAIASIPQFKLSIVEALPETGEKMTLYLVSKGTESPDVYDEYIWIEQTSTFEFLGTTAVDLTDYVKKTDYAGNTGGVIKSSVAYSTKINDGFLTAVSETLDNYNIRPNASFVSKGTLENVLTQYKKVSDPMTEDAYNDLETKDANTLYLIEE